MEPVTEKARSVSHSEHDYSKACGNSNVLNSHTSDNNVSGTDELTENVNEDVTKHLSEYAGMFSIEQHFVCLACLTCFKTDSSLVVHLQIHICKQVTDVRLPEGNIGPHEVHEETVSNDVCETDSTCPDDYNITPVVSLMDNLVASDGSIYLPMDLCQYNFKDEHIEFPILIADQTIQHKTMSSSSKPQQSSSYLCLICQSRVNCYTDLEMHLQQHLSEGIYNNATDNKKINGVTGLSQASTSVLTIKPEFEANTDINSYTRTTDGDIGRLYVMQPKDNLKSHICRHCKKLFSSREWLTKHIKREHSLEIQMQNNKLVFCKFCDKAFAYVKLYRSHVKRCHPDNYNEVLKPKEPKHCKQPHMCEYCGKIFTDRHQCMIHVQRVHSIDKSYLCDICGRSFSFKNDFKIHCRTHEGFKCLKCDLTFKSRYLRKKHQVQHIRHVKVKQKTIKSIIQCEICKKSYTGNARCVAYHKLICCLEKTITCHMCQKRFALQKHLRVHVKKVHGELKFKCDICSRAFPFKCTLNYHIRRKHELERSYKCSLCAYGSISKGRLAIHMETHSNVKRYSCTICSKSFKQKWTLTVHMKSNHS